MTSPDDLFELPDSEIWDRLDDIAPAEASDLLVQALEEVPGFGSFVRTAVTGRLSPRSAAHVLGVDQ